MKWEVQVPKRWQDVGEVRKMKGGGQEMRQGKCRRDRKRMFRVLSITDNGWYPAVHIPRVETLCGQEYFLLIFVPLIVLVPESCSVFLKLIFIELQLIYSVVFIYSLKQSESVVHIHISTLFKILFPYRSLQNTEQCSLCCTVVLTSYLILFQFSYLYQIEWYVNVSPKLLIYPSPPFPPW